MSRVLFLILAGLAVWCVRAAGAVFSGPQPGEKVTPFKVVGITGVDSGKERDPITAPG